MKRPTYAVMILFGLIVICVRTGLPTRNSKHTIGIESVIDRDTDVTIESVRNGADRLATNYLRKPVLSSMTIVGNCDDVNGILEAHLIYHGRTWTIAGIQKIRADFRIDIRDKSVDIRILDMTNYYPNDAPLKHTGIEADMAMGIARDYLIEHKMCMKQYRIAMMGDGQSWDVYCREVGTSRCLHIDANTGMVTK